MSQSDSILSLISDMNIQIRSLQAEVVSLRDELEQNPPEAGA